MVYNILTEIKSLCKKNLSERVNAVTSEKILALLRGQNGGYLSGEAISAHLGITRAAVWKGIQTLRKQGYEISAVTNKGYRLVFAPDKLTLGEIQSRLKDHPWSGDIIVLDSVDSTNNYAKKIAADGARNGTVVIAHEQTAGKGRQGRGFSSSRGMGVYLTALLRPNLAPGDLIHVTAMAAVAVCNAVQAVCGVRPQIKWTNDVVFGDKKLCGILTELSVIGESGELEYLVIGSGVNVRQETEDFPPEVREKAVSIYQQTGILVDRSVLAAEMIMELYKMSKGIVLEKQWYLEQYAKDCVTIGKDIRIIRGDREFFAHAEGIDENAALIVTYESGERDVLTSGEVSVRGLDGYT